MTHTFTTEITLPVEVTFALESDSAPDIVSVRIERLVVSMALLSRNTQAEIRMAAADRVAEAEADDLSDRARAVAIARAV